MRSRVLFLSILLLFVNSRSFAATELDSEAYWEYGIGFGAIRFAQYPASNQYTLLALPAPTFQYRGKILRADDRDGAHLYLLKEDRFTIEIAGDGTPALASKNNQARTGMEDLPWMLALGPQLVWRLSDNIEFSLGVFQSVTTDFVMTRTTGNIFSGQVTYQWSSLGRTRGKIIFSADGGTKEYQSLYFEVPPAYATPERPAYAARDGLLTHSLGYFQSYKSGRFSLYTGASLSSYALSANRMSPLHKSDQNLSLVIGMNYTLGGSTRPAVPESETSGVINSIRANRQLRDSF